MTSLTASPTLVVFAAIALLVAAGTALQAHRRWYRAAALAEIDTLRFGAFVGLIRRAMAARGFQTDCKLGAAAHAYELDAHRDGRRYLVACKLGASTRVSARSVLALDRDVTARAALGAFIVTSGSVERGAHKLARDLGIEIIDGHAFWRDVRGALTDDLRRGIARRLRSSYLRYARRGLISGSLLAAAGASAMALAVR